MSKEKFIQLHNKKGVSDLLKMIGYVAVGILIAIGMFFAVKNISNHIFFT